MDGYDGVENTSYEPSCLWDAASDTSPTDSVSSKNSESPPRPPITCGYDGCGISAKDSVSHGVADDADPEGKFSFATCCVRFLSVCNFGILVLVISPITAATMCGSCYIVQHVCEGVELPSTSCTCSLQIMSRLRAYVTIILVWPCDKTD